MPSDKALQQGGLACLVASGIDQIQLLCSWKDHPSILDFCTSLWSYPLESTHCGNNIRPVLCSTQSCALSAARSHGSPQCQWYAASCLQTSWHWMPFCWHPSSACFSKLVYGAHYSDALAHCCCLAGCILLVLSILVQHHLHQHCCFLLLHQCVATTRMVWEEQGVC